MRRETTPEMKEGNRKKTSSLVKVGRELNPRQSSSTTRAFSSVFPTPEESTMRCSMEDTVAIRTIITLEYSDLPFDSALEEIDGNLAREVDPNGS